MEMLERDLKEKEKQIELMRIENLKMKEMNDLMMIKDIKQSKNE